MGGGVMCTGLVVDGGEVVRVGGSRCGEGEGEQRDG